mgnify:CR=1 FL=1
MKKANSSVVSLKSAGVKPGSAGIYGAYALAKESV